MLSNKKTTMPITAVEGGTSQIEDAKQYLEKHKIPLLMEMLTAALIVERPANPREFIKMKLKELKENPPTRIKPSPLHLFTREDLGALFKIFDVTDKGWITLDQYLEGMSNIGVVKPNMQPQGAAKGKITLDTFCDEALSGTHKRYP